LRQAAESSVAAVTFRPLLAVLAGSLQWHDEQVNRAVCMTQMCYAIERRGYSFPVIEEAVRRLIESADWMPSTAAVLRSCDAVQGEVRELIRHLAWAAIVPTTAASQPASDLFNNLIGKDKNSLW